eukprot:1932598-Pyramimonas_sp.AAC.1
MARAPLSAGRPKTLARRFRGRLRARRWQGRSTIALAAPSRRSLRGRHFVERVVEMDSRARAASASGRRPP